MESSSIKIIEIDSSHGDAILRIYKEGLETGNATFATSVPTWDEWDKSHLDDLRYVAIIAGNIAGWIALSPVSSRCVYGGVAEISVYVGEVSAAGKWVFL